MEFRQKDLDRMRFLVNRLPMARFRVDRALGLGGELLEQARDTQRALREELAELQARAKVAFEAVDDPLERQLLEMRYLRGLSVRRIAYAVNYSERHVFRVLKSAEGRFEG